MMFSAGIGPIHLVRLVQWSLALPLVWHYLVSLLALRLPDPVWELLENAGLDPWPAHVVLFAAAVVLEISERAVASAEQSFANQLHDMLKTIGDGIREGQAVESAVAEAAQGSSGPAGLFREALELSADMPFESALRAVADSSGRPYFKEVGQLVSMAVNSPGDAGQAIRVLGTELERSYRLTTGLTAKTGASLGVLKGTALIAVPPLYRVLTRQFDASIDLLNSVVIWEARLFFTYGAVAATAIDGIVFDQWDKIPARLPLNLCLVYAGLSVM